MSKGLTGAMIFTGSSVLLLTRIFMRRRSSAAVKMVSTSAPDIEDCGKVICVKRGSIPTEVEAGKTYFYCTCGRSTKQPFCDGKHKVKIEDHTLINWSLSHFFSGLFSLSFSLSHSLTHSLSLSHLSS